MISWNRSWVNFNADAFDNGCFVRSEDFENLEAALSAFRTDMKASKFLHWRRKAIFQIIRSEGQLRALTDISFHLIQVRVVD